MQEIERPRGNIHTAHLQCMKYPSWWNVRREYQDIFHTRPKPDDKKPDIVVNVERIVEWCKETQGMDNLNTFSLDGQKEALSYFLCIILASDAKLKRVDFKFDWKETKYREMIRINRLFLACYEVGNGVKNNWDTKSVMRPETKSLKEETKRYAFEYYDKTEQAPWTAQERGISARFEARIKDMISAGDDIDSGLERIKKKLEEFPRYLKKVEKVQNEILYNDYWVRESRTASQWNRFFIQYQDYFYTERQIQDFMVMIGRVDDAKRGSYNKQIALKKDGKPPLVSSADLKKYVAAFLEVYEEYKTGKQPKYKAWAEEKAEGFHY